jgi:hypothetical protein
MKCFEYRQGYIFPGMAITHANNQSYIDLAGPGYEPECKVFLTDQLIDQLYDSQELSHLYFAELVLQGDGRYWLARPKSSAKVGFALIRFTAQKQEPGEYKVDLRNGRDSVVLMSKERRYGDRTVFYSLGFITHLAPGEMITVRHELTYKVPGTGRTLCQPFNKALYARHVAARTTICYDGTNVDVSHD